jgi:hypothetical protein
VIILGHKKIEVRFLYVLLILSIGILPVLFKRPSKKEWLLVFSFNGITNIILDKWVTKNFISYPTRLLPSIFNIHILYDALLYPMVSVIYNQWTSKDKPIVIVCKLLFFSVPLTIFEFLTERKTGLIKWSNGWQWYHTLLSVSLKSLFTRSVVAIYRGFTKEENLINAEDTTTKKFQGDGSPDLFSI